MSNLKSYYPIFLIIIYILFFSLLIEVKNTSFNPEQMMAHFMGGFFVVFSFFKFLNLPGFVKAYKNYDLISKWIPGYAC